ncbi:hypothetical protein SAMN05216553_106459 [Lentzea fradiae]|uniref:Uncharacterized protein n=1 Tax=Lentzea fradiae TaxID=200378 RepID=A0A1G7ST17_9PSEU|nr:hypothetical protein SAMN05216553_106459 [Lentzea fradiae]
MSAFAASARMASSAAAENRWGGARVASRYSARRPSALGSSSCVIRAHSATASSSWCHPFSCSPADARARPSSIQSSQSSCSSSSTTRAHRSASAWSCPASARRRRPRAALMNWPSRRPITWRKSRRASSTSSQNSRWLASRSNGVLRSGWAAATRSASSATLGCVGCAEKSSQARSRSRSTASASSATLIAYLASPGTPGAGRRCRRRRRTPAPAPPGRARTSWTGRCRRQRPAPRRW